MKRGLLLFLIASRLFALTNRIEGNYYVVTDSEGKEYRQKIAGSSLNMVYQCGESVCGVYDGNELNVFDLKAKQFIWQKTKTDYPFGQMTAQGDLLSFYDGERLHIYSGWFTSQKTAQYKYPKISGSSDLVAFYDGAQFWIFDRSLFAFESWKARTLALNARVASLDKVAAFYDGGEFSVYDGTNHRLYSQRVNTSLTSLLIAGRSSAIFYGGESLYCFTNQSKKFVIKKYQNQDWGDGNYDPNLDQFIIKIGKESLEIKGDCSSLSK